VEETVAVYREAIRETSGRRRKNWP